MATKGSGKKTRSSAARPTGGGRGTNQYQVQVRQSDFNADSDVDRASVVNAMARAQQRPATSIERGSDNYGEILNQMDDALHEGQPNQVLVVEGRIRSSTTDFVGRAATSSVRSDHAGAFVTDYDDRIREDLASNKMSPTDLRENIIGSKTARLHGEKVSDAEEQDIYLTSDIEARLTKLGSHNGYRDINDLSDSINQLSQRRIASVGF